MIGILPKLQTHQECHLLGSTDATDVLGSVADGVFEFTYGTVTYDLDTTVDTATQKGVENSRW